MADGSINENKSVIAPDKISLTIAWIAMLVISAISIIMWREFISTEPWWWPWLCFGILLAIFILTLFLPSLKQIRVFILILLLIFVLGFGGGWQWGIIPFIRESIAWKTWVSGLSWEVEALATHLLRLIIPFIIMGVLLLLGRNRKDFFLVKGNLRAPIEPTKLLGIKKPEPWPKTAIIFASIFTSVTFIFLLLTTQPTLDAFIIALPRIPIALLIAAMNAFNEEFTLRAAPLSEINESFGKQQALLITSLYFGLGHFYGIPNGILGVLLASFLGWFIGKNILETKGFFWAWLLHFLPDVCIFSFIAISS